jgi:protein-disulfide isomerase
MMTSDVNAPKLTTPVSARDHIQGSPQAPVLLVQYGDYECPYCGMAYPVVKEIQSRLGGMVAFVFRNFPLKEKHTHAMQAAEAAEAANAQGRFWQMHDMLYENQQNLQYQDLLDYAESLDLDLEQFEQDLMQHTYAERVREDFLSGVRSGVNGTPTFYINGIRHDGGDDLESLLAAITAAAEHKVHIA